MNTSTTSNTWRWVGLIILLLLLLLLWLMSYGPSFSGSTPGCCGVPLAETAPPPAVAPVAAAQSPVNLDFRNNDGKVTLTGEVPSEAERQNLVNAATQAFGAGNVIDQLTVKANTALPGWWGRLSSVFDWLKSGSNFGLNQIDKLLTLTGMVDNDAASQEKANEINALLGDGESLNNSLQIKSAPVAQTPAAPAVPECSADMNVAIQFQTNSAKLSADGKKQLDEVAKCLNSPTEVAGHTDADGSDAYNMRLSKARAQAALTYIKSAHPAKAKLLTSSGYGEIKPIADNGTEAGKAQNRRIEFKVK